MEQFKHYYEEYMKKLIICTSLLLASGLLFAKDTVTFNHKGELITPDEVHLIKGFSQVKEGFPQQAIESFPEASRYGTEQARLSIGQLQMEQNNYTEALAWLKLVNSKAVGQEGNINELKANIKAKLSDDKFNLAENRFLELEAIHNPIQAREYRENWRDGVNFSSSKLRRMTKSGMQFTRNPNLTERERSSQVFVKQQHAKVNPIKLRKDINNFVENYTYANESTSTDS